MSSRTLARVLIPACLVTLAACDRGPDASNVDSLDTLAGHDAYGAVEQCQPRYQATGDIHVTASDPSLQAIATKAAGAFPPGVQKAFAKGRIVVTDDVAGACAGTNVTDAERSQLASCRHDEADGFTIMVKADAAYLESYTVRALSYYLADTYLQPSLAAGVAGDPLAAERLAKGYLADFARLTSEGDPDLRLSLLNDLLPENVLATGISAAERETRLEGVFAVQGTSLDESAAARVANGQTYYRLVAGEAVDAVACGDAMRVELSSSGRFRETGAVILGQLHLDQAFTDQGSSLRDVATAQRQSYDDFLTLHQKTDVRGMFAAFASGPSLALQDGSGPKIHHKTFDNDAGRGGYATVKGDHFAGGAFAAQSAGHHFGVVGIGGAAGGKGGVGGAFAGIGYAHVGHATVVVPAAGLGIWSRGSSRLEE